MKQKLEEEIKRSKGLMNINEDSNMVKLNSTSYPNVKFDNDGTQNDYVNDALLQDIQKAAESVGIVATITTAKSGHSQLTINGQPSRHMTGTGVDVAILNGVSSGGATSSRNGNEKFKILGEKLKNKLVEMGYKWNVEVGNDKAVLWQTNTGGNHFNHLHISNKTGASEELPTGSSREEDDLFNLLGTNINGISLKDLIGITDDDIESKPDFIDTLKNLAAAFKGIKKI
jgi:hypothetical protein